MEDYINIYAVRGDPYDPYDMDKCLPKEHRQFTVCAECGRQAQDCWAMGSMVNFNSPFDQPSYVACAYCSTYRALVAFMAIDVKWFDALQLQVSQTAFVRSNLLNCLPLLNDMVCSTLFGVLDVNLIQLVCSHLYSRQHAYASSSVGPVQAVIAVLFCIGLR